VTGIGGQPLDVALVHDVARPGVGGVEHVLVEPGLHRGEPLHHRAEALLPLGRQRHAGQAEVAQRILDHLALLRSERGALGVHHRLVGRAQLGVLAELGVVGGEQRQAGVVGGAQLVAVHHAVQVPDRRPRPGETVMHAFER